MYHIAAIALRFVPIREGAAFKCIAQSRQGIQVHGQQMTKSVHQNTPHQGPVWCERRWRGFIFDEVHWNRTVDYIERHNERKGLPRKPYRFIM